MPVKRSSNLGKPGLPARPVAAGADAANDLAPGRHGLPTLPVGALRQAATLPLGIVGLLLVWHFLARSIDAEYLLPSPARVWTSATENAGLIVYHGRMTLLEVLLGFALGCGLAIPLGYAISRSTAVERAVTPYIVASQAVPIVAIAPLLVIWLDNDLLVTVLAAAIVLFFPMLVNTVVGLRNIPAAERDLMRVMSASRWQTLRLLEVPAALPVLLAGMRVGLTLSVIGAVVGEFIGPDRGLGVLLTIAKDNYRTPLMFAALMSLVTLALVLYGAATLLERALLRRR